MSSRIEYRLRARMRGEVEGMPLSASDANIYRMLNGLPHEPIVHKKKVSSRNALTGNVPTSKKP